MGTFETHSTEFPGPRDIGVKNDRPHHIQAIFDLAVDAGKRADYREAGALLAQVCTLEAILLRDLFSMVTEKQRLLLAIRAQLSLASLLAVAIHYPSADPFQAEVFECVLRLKGFTLERASEILAAARLQLDPELHGLYKALKAQRASIAEEVVESICRSETATLSTRRISLMEARREEIENAIAARLDKSETIAQVTISKVVEALPPRSVLLEYIQYPELGFDGDHRSRNTARTTERLAVFVLPQDDPKAVRFCDLGPATEIQELIHRWQSVITSQVDDTDDVGYSPVTTNRLGNSLRERLLDPVIQYVGNRSRLIVALDGILSVLPFEALPSGHGEYIIDRYDVSYINAAREVLRWRVSPRRTTSAIVIGAPDFDAGLQPADKGGTSQTAIGLQKWQRPVDLGLALDFDPLPWAEEEACRVAAILKTEAWTGSKASKARLRAECRSPLALHVATHGFFLPTDDPTFRDDWRSHVDDHPFYYKVPGLDSPMVRSGLALAGARTKLRLGTPPYEAENGFLTAEEVLDLDLLNTDLVVLSGCVTAKGDAIPGEGVFGLRRAFLIAGAQTVVAACWHVSDRVTVRFMECFYNKLSSGISRAEALLVAKKDTRDVFPNPFHWAPFICLGNPAAMPPFSNTDAAPLLTDDAIGAYRSHRPRSSIRELMGLGDIPAKERLVTSGTKSSSTTAADALLTKVSQDASAPDRARANRSACIAICDALAARDPHDPEDLQFFDRILPYAERLVLEYNLEHAWAGGSIPELLVLNRLMGRYFFAQGDLDKALSHQKRAIECALTEGQYSPEVLSAFADLGMTLVELGDTNEARDLLRKALEGGERFSELHQEAVLKLHQSLAYSLLYAGQHAEAKTFFERVISGRRRILGPEHPDTLESSEGWALVEKRAGQPAAALGEELRLLRIRTHVLGPDHPDTLKTLHNAGFTLSLLGNTDGALEMYREAHQGRQRRLGDAHPLTLVSQLSVGAALFEKGHTADAEQMVLSAKETAERHLGDDVPITHAAMRNLYRIKAAQGDADAAEQLYGQLFRACERRLGSGFREKIYHLLERGQLDEGEKALTRCLEVLAGVLGHESRDYLEALDALAQTLKRKPNYDGARAALEELLSLKKTLFGGTHEETMRTMGDLTSVLFDQGDLVAAIPIQLELVELSRLYRRVNDAETIGSMGKLAVMLLRTGRAARAIVLLEEVLRLQADVLGANHPHTLATAQFLKQVKG